MQIKKLDSFDRVISTAPDKSVTHRAFILGFMSEQGIRIHNPLRAQDTRSTLECLRRLGAVIEDDGSSILVKNGRSKPDAALDAGNSGTTLRLLTGALAGMPGYSAELGGDKSLSARPMRRLIDPLHLMGACISYSGALPVRVTGRRLRGISYELPDASAQVKSALLLAGLSADGETVIGGKTGSRDHTELMMSAMGVVISKNSGTITLSPGKPGGLDFCNHGDFSSAAYAFALAAIKPGGSVTVRDVNINPTRTAMLDILTGCGASVGFSAVGEDIEKYADVCVSASAMKPFRIKPETVPYMIDELPLMAVIACFIEGESIIEGAGELRLKESDRIIAICRGLTAMGAEIEAQEDRIVIRGKGGLKGGAQIETYGDHRIAMSLAVGAAGAEKPCDIELDSTSVSYPDFIGLFSAEGKL